MISRVVLLTPPLPTSGPDPVRVLLRHLEPDRDSTGVAPQRRTLKAEVVEECDHVGDVSVDVVRLSAPRRVAAPVAAMVEENGGRGGARLLLLLANLNQCMAR